MKRIITVSTESYKRNTQRLLISLNKTNRDFCLYIYCDKFDSFESLKAIGNCEIIELASINNRGVKRAKFEAYRAAIEEGDFVYLDSDIIILDDLSVLFKGENIKGSFDDLSACNFISDKRFPWSKDPFLENKYYINSGVFYAPRSKNVFFRHLYDQSIDDQIWNRYVIEDKLLDNHFLCAFINKENEKIEYIDGDQFNWQGFCKDNRVVAIREADALLNRVNEKKLYLVHFAGQRDIDGFILSLPINISSLLLSYCIDMNYIFNEPPLFYFIADQNQFFQSPLEDDFIAKVGSSLIAEVNDISKNRFRKKYAVGESYFIDKDSLISLAYAKPNSINRWNNLKCDGAYLEAQEYVYLRDIISQYRIKSVIEIGAGETSILFKELNVTALSIEALNGSWFQRAVEKGCNVHHIEYDHNRLLFDDEKLRKIISTSKRNVGLIFIDSPVGTQSRSKVLTQLLQYVKPKYVLFHDAYRDARNIYSYQTEHGLTIVNHFESTRGMVLFAFDPSSASHKAQQDIIDNRIISPNYEMKLNHLDKSLLRSSEHYLTLCLKNTSGEIYASNFHNPVFVSYHWIDTDDSSVVIEGIRTPLPCVLHPLDSIEFTMKIITPDGPGMYLLEVDLVQEMVSWFKMMNPNLGMRTEIQIT